MHKHPIVILQIKLWEFHWLFRRVYGFKFKAAAVYMVRVTSRKLHCDVMKTIILDVRASFSGTIFKSWECFSRLHVFTVEYPLNWSVFLVYYIE